MIYLIEERPCGAWITKLRFNLPSDIAARGILEELTDRDPQIERRLVRISPEGGMTVIREHLEEGRQSNFCEHLNYRLLCGICRPELLTTKGEES